ncbi:HD domain-containing protein [Spirillospora albida]|uniref:HD domain-containing protein n=1 Tax=Spirillospora albida TaxID=58123 RepID=UPI0004BF2FF1|nr:HD domain-containing protein [Spirillospora albida]
MTDFRFPGTDLAREAYDLAFAEESPALANHSVRSYLFARALADLDGAPYDDEVLFLSCVLHDIGLTDRGDGSQRFEVDGADVAAGFLREHGCAEERVQIVWQAIALHTSSGIAHRMPGEIALAHIGIGVDVRHMGAERLPAGFADEVHAAFPRLEPGCGLLKIITEQVARDPAKAPFGSLPYELARQQGVLAHELRWEELERNAWSGVA